MIENEANISASRKDEHIKFALDQAQTRLKRNDFDNLEFIHHALDAVDTSKVTLKTNIFGTEWNSPLYINAMTGGSAKAGNINADLAAVAKATGLALASGSMSPVFKDPETIKTFTVLRDHNPNGFVIANINANTSPEEATFAVDLLQANALQIHVNTVQELTMHEGDRNFQHWLKNIAAIVASTEVPVIVKEVGFGISLKTAKKLASIGVKNIDVSGSGGTNFALIEQARSKGTTMPELSSWGLSTVQSLLQNTKLNKHNVTLLASGGVRNPLDVAKALALGAKAVGVAGGFLQTLTESGQRGLIKKIEFWKQNLKIVQSLLGLESPKNFPKTQIFISGKTAEFCAANKIDTQNFALR